MKQRTRKILYVILFLTITIYSFNSLNYIIKWSFSKSSKEEYLLLEKKYKLIKKEKANLKEKVDGLNESTLNKEVLEIQAKQILKLAKKDEIIIIN